MTAPPRLAVAVGGDADVGPDEASALRATAARWAGRLALPLLATPFTKGAPLPPEVDMLLLVTSRGLALHAVRGAEALTRGKPVTIDLHKLDTTTGHGRSLRQPLMRAVGLRKGDPHRPSVLDATAGLGEDAWLLARTGCPVLAVERHRVVAAMLENAIERATAGLAHPATGHADVAAGSGSRIARSLRVPKTAAADVAAGSGSRIAVLTADSRALLEHLASGRPLHTFLSGDADGGPVAGSASSDWVPFEAAGPEVIYIDPMFPPGRKTAERKPLLLLRALVGGDLDADALLGPARRAARRRVVVKRSRRAAPLAGAAPAATHHGRGVRYDVYPADTV